MCEEEKVCRTCLSNNKNMFDLFSSEDSEEITLANMLKYISLLEVSFDDKLPNLICDECANVLKISYNYKKQCERFDYLLRNYMNEQCENVQIQPMKVEIGQTTESTLDDSVYFPCKMCEKTFSKENYLKLHKKVHQINHCKHCGLIFRTQKDFKKHAAEDKYKCEGCDIKLCTSGDLEQHIISHKPEYICLINDNVVNDETKLITDVKLDEYTEETIKAELLTCEVCLQQFITNGELEAHIKVHEPDHVCISCKIVFSKYEKFADHNKKCHNKYNCKTCTKSFTTPNALSGHMRHHIQVLNGRESVLYKCTIDNCGRTFSSLDYLRRHKPAHATAKRTFLCNLCGKICTSNNSYYYHKKMHKNERPFVCSSCGNTYKLISHLKNHMWIHTGEKPHECTSCGKRFSRRLVLKRHIATKCGSKKKLKAVSPDVLTFEDQTDFVNKNCL